MFGSGYHKKSFEKQVEQIDPNLGAALQTAQGIALRVRKNIRERGNEGITHTGNEPVFVAWFDETSGTAFIASGKDRWGRWITVGITYDDDECCVRIDQMQHNPVPRKGADEAALIVGDRTRYWLKEDKPQDSTLITYTYASSNDERLRQLRVTEPTPGAPISADVADNLAASFACFADVDMRPAMAFGGLAVMQQRASAENDSLQGAAE